MRRLRRRLARTLTAAAACLAAACTTTATTRPVAVEFVDATVDAGLDAVHHDLRSAPNCMFNSADQPSDYHLPQDPAGCMEERMAGGAAAGDYDGDGRIDLLVTRLYAPPMLYRNAGEGRFEDATAQAGLEVVDVHTNGAAFADVDNDGDADLYLTTMGASRFLLFVNDGGRFTEQGVQRGAAVADDVPRAGYSVTAGDYDLDGWVDLHTTEWRSHRRQFLDPPEHARLLRNRGADAPGHFEDVTERAGARWSDALPSGPQGPMVRLWPKFSFASTFVDLNGDRHPELVVASDFGSSHLLWNDGDGTFSDGTNSPGLEPAENAMGSTFGDYDNDGDLDWYTTGIYDPEASADPKTAVHSGNRLARNDGDGRFTDVTEFARVVAGHWGWGAAFLDYDNDGRLDLFSATGQDSGGMEGGYGVSGDLEPAMFRNTPPKLWRNVGGGRFADVGERAGVADRREGKGVLVFDYDDDGDLDVFTVNNGDRPVLYRNDGGNASGWLRVRVLNAAGADALGAVVTVLAGDGSEQVRQIGVGTHFLGQSENVAHFGLGSRTVDEVRVLFPASGRTVVERDTAVRSTLVVREPR